MMGNEERQEGELNCLAFNLRDLFIMMDKYGVLEIIKICIL
jgi:hypothetical protein